jgi:hypothetical protein
MQCHEGLAFTLLFLLYFRYLHILSNFTKLLQLLGDVRILQALYPAVGRKMANFFTGRSPAANYELLLAAVYVVYTYLAGSLVSSYQFQTNLRFSVLP